MKKEVLLFKILKHRLNKNLFIVLISLFQYHSQFAQQTKIDSTLTLLKKDKMDSNRVIHLNDLASLHRGNNPDTSIIIGEEALTLAQKLNWKIGIANTLADLGYFNYLKADYPSALDLYLKALKIDEELKNKSGIAKRLGSIGLVYWNMADYPKALDYSQKALMMAEELLKQNKNPSTNKVSMALIGTNLSNLGLISLDQSDNYKALDYFNKALKIAEELGDKKRIAITLSNIGIIYRKKSDYKTSLDYFFKALKLFEELGNKNGIAVRLGNIGVLYTKMGKYKEAEAYLNKAIDIETKIGALDFLRQFEEGLSELYDTLGRSKEALIHFKKATALKDTLFSQENRKQLVRKELNYEFEKKQLAIKAEQDKKDAIAKEELKQKEQQRNYFIIGFVLVATLALFIFRGYKQKQKANIIINQQKEEVENKNKIIEEKNKDILDSIRYAQRIQTSLLPTKKYIERILNERDKKTKID